MLNLVSAGFLVFVVFQYLVAVLGFLESTFCVLCTLFEKSLNRACGSLFGQIAVLEKGNCREHRHGALCIFIIQISK